MDPVSVLGLASSLLAILEGLQKAYRFGRDVIQSDDQRDEFTHRLDYVKTVVESLKALIETENTHADREWVRLIDPEVNARSPIKGLKLTVDTMVDVLNEKRTGWRQNLKKLEWHSEKKILEKHFTEIDGFCTGISVILGAANIGFARENVTFLRENHIITKDLVAKFEEDREQNKILQEGTKRLQVEQEKRREESEKRREESEKKTIESWLSPFDFQAQRHEKLDGAARTGKQFLDSPEFQNWEHGDVQLLRCYGPAGAGKTILSAIVLDHLINKLPRSIPVLCIYFEQKPTSPYTPNNLLGSLLKQLVQARELGLPAGLKAAYVEASRINAKLTQQEMKTILETELALYDQIYLVVDALDEASDASRNLIERYIRRLRPGNLKMMTTRREDTELSQDIIACNLCDRECAIWHHCNDCPQNNEDRMDLCQSCKDAGTGCLTNPAHNLTVPKVVEKLISTSNEDLEIYVKAVIEDQMPDSVSEDDPGPPPSSKFGRVCHENASLLSEIIDTIVNISKGRFLLAKQYTRSLTSKQTLGAIRRAMRELKKDQYSLAEMIDKMYDDDMAIRIKKQDPEMAKYAIRILAIISTARRNLRLTELQHALATWEEYTTTEYDSEEQLDRQQILDMTKGLVRIDRDKEATVRLDHRTLEEYFQKTRSEHFPDSEADMAKVCLKYLNFNEFARPCNEVSDFAVKEQSHVFISYAVQYWGDHVREAVSNSPSEHEVISIAAKYLQTPLRLEAYAQAAWASSTLEHDKWDVRRTIHPLHVCAWFDLDYLISALDYQTMDLDVREQTYGQTPLMYACRRGNINVARRLMELGASMNLISGRGRTALFEAVLSEQPSLVELLLGSEFKVFDVDVNVKNEKLYNRTALMVAADRGLEDIAHELLKHDRISVNEQDSEGNTALSLACSQGHLNIASALSTKPGINLNIKEKQFGRTALLLAAELNHAEIVDDLLCNGAETDLEDMRGGNAVLRAAEEGGLEALQKLIDYGATVGDEKVGADEEGRTPLHLASRNEHIEVLQILVEKYSNLDIRDDNGLTPLHHTCQSGALETAAFLLEQGADPAILDAFGRTPFVVAWQYGHKDLIDLFREKGKLSPTDLTQSLEAKDLPLWSLVIQRELDCIKAAISANKADVTIKEPGTDNTVLHLALIEREKECLVDETRGQLLRTLLPTAARYIDEPDNCGRSPLHLAALYGSIEATNILLEADPPLDRSDRFGLTPLAIAFRNSFPMAAKLIEAGANIPLSGIDIQKMLFKCILLQNVTAVKFLVAAGADATAPDDFGRTVNQLAKLTGHPALVHIVQSIKSSMWRVKRAETTKTSPVVEVVEILKDMPVDQFPSLSQLPRLPLRSTPILNDIEKTAMYA